MQLRLSHHLLLIAIACGSVTDLHSAPISIDPVADAFVSSSNPANNYGGAGSFHVSAPGLPNGEFQALLKFDLSTAKASFDADYGVGNWALSSASLQLNAANPNNLLFNASAPGVIDIGWMQNDTWTEGSGTPSAPGASGITWDTLPTFLSPGDQQLGSINFTGATSGSTLYPLILSSGLDSDAQAGDLTSIRLNAAPGDTAVAGLFNSRSFGNAASRPLLLLDAVQIPEPSTFILIAGGLVGLLLHGSRGAALRRSLT